jgi:predicted GNAT superfamily acetyltransferase
MTDGELQSITGVDASPAAPLREALLILNNAHAQELSWLEPERLQHLVEQAFLVRRIGNLDAFMLALDQDAQYDSPNFLWFRALYPRFVYVDRIVVASTARAGFMWICLNMRCGQDTIVSSAKSTRALQTRNRTLSMPHWDLSK